MILIKNTKSTKVVKDHVISPDIVVVLVSKSFSHSCFNANVLKDYVGIYFNT